jgi:hypothetical protein
MKYAYKVESNGYVHFTSGENVVFWKELTEDEYNIHINARHNKKQIIYIDENGKLQARDKFTIWDEATNSWLPDVKAIRDTNNNEVINQARIAYNAGNLDRHQFSKLSHDQQLRLTKYLDELLDIINIKELPDYEIYLPPALEFLN